jgi:hypothetical protein
MKIVSWNCNGKFREKFRFLFDAYNDADIYIIEECEDPYFYDDEEFKRLFVNGFRIGIPSKGLAVIAKENVVIKKMRWKGDTEFSFAPIMVNSKFIILATWTHGKYVEELMDYLESNDRNLYGNTLIIGDLNSNKIFDDKHKGKSHSDLVKRLRSKGLEDLYHYFMGEKQGEETIPTFYMQRKLDKSFHLDHAFMNPQYVKQYIIPPIAEHEDWLKHSDHIPIAVETKF